MKRAAGDLIGTRFLERNEMLDHVDDIDAVEEILFERFGNHLFNDGQARPDSRLRGAAGRAAGTSLLYRRYSKNRKAFGVTPNAAGMPPGRSFTPPVSTGGAELRPDQRRHLGHIGLAGKPAFERAHDLAHVAHGLRAGL